MLRQYVDEFVDRVEKLQVLAARDAEEVKGAQTIHVAGVGSKVLLGYESLRNATEYSENQTLLQGAMVRFFVRNATFFRKKEDLAEKLIIELTLSGYLINDTVTEAKMTKIREIVTEHLKFAQENKGEEIKKFVYEPLAAKIDDVLFPHKKGWAVAQLGYDYFVEMYADDFRAAMNKRRAHLMLLLATMKTLLKPTEGAMREHILGRYNIAVSNRADYLALNREISDILEDGEFHKLTRKISNRCAPLRVVLKQTENGSVGRNSLKTPEAFLATSREVIEEQYRGVKKVIFMGVVKSLIFLLITKMLLGVAIEVPFDILIEGEVNWTPLLINLFFPPVFMLLLSFTLKSPGEHNTKRLLGKVQEILWVDEKHVLNGARADHIFQKTHTPMVFSLAYVLFFLAILGVTAWGLVALEFNIVSILIFFVFLSTASFLCFRLSRMIREWEVVEENQGFVRSLLDFLYMPFVTIGQWVTEKYAKVNLVSNFLSVAVEMPLKEIIFMMRRWNAFMSSKKDEL